MFFSHAAPLPHFLAQSVQQRPITLPLCITLTLESILWSGMTGHILLTGFLSWGTAPSTRLRTGQASVAAKATARTTAKCFMTRSFHYWIRQFTLGTAPRPKAAAAARRVPLCGTAPRQG